MASSPIDGGNRVPTRGLTSPPDDFGSTRVAHTLTACSRCRQRKTRCDPGLPRCGPCERTNAVCEYWDPAKHRNINRDYVVWLQQRVRELELEADQLENEDGHEDPELMVRSGATVKLQDAEETKFLGPSSGTQLTRIVMQLAKQFTDTKTIKDIVPDAKARQVKELIAAEEDKPTSKVYPLISDVAAEDLPNRGLTNLLVELYNLKVQPMYPALHEPTFARDLETVYAEQGNPYQNFILRMVIAISLQKMDTQYAGLADSYYLAALRYMAPVVHPMNLQTLQCFALIAQYSLLTPTRTAIYYIMGLAVRLAQALGIHEEKTITRGRGGATADFLEVDMRRRLFWCVFVMECGLSHALGRPASLATGREHLDVGWFETCADEYITPQGLLPGGPRATLKKWIAIHFFKMRLLQLEIRRTLYLKKRSEPKDDQDPWFQQMLEKLESWRDTSPDNDEGIGLDKVWFIGRFNTMIAFLYRPSPQVPRPSAMAALKCFDAGRYNIYMTREQIRRRNVDLTWIFAQAIFLAINTMLWSLSYAEVRKRNPKSEVQMHLSVCMEAIGLAASRWPGVASAHELYTYIIEAILKIYDKDGDVQIPANTPSDEPSPALAFSDGTGRSRTTSPASGAFDTPPEQPGPFGYFHHSARRSIEQPPPLPYHAQPTPPIAGNNAPPGARSTMAPHMSPESVEAVSYGEPLRPPPLKHYDSSSNMHYQRLPENFGTLVNSGWSSADATGDQTKAYLTPANPYSQQAGAYADLNGYDYAYSGNGLPSLQATALDYLNPSGWSTPTSQQGMGLTSEQQGELMQSLETQGMEDIESLINASNAIFNPSSRVG